MAVSLLWHLRPFCRRHLRALPKLSGYRRFREISALCSEHQSAECNVKWPKNDQSPWTEKLHFVQFLTEICPRHKQSGSAPQLCQLPESTEGQWAARGSSWSCSLRQGRAKLSTASKRDREDRDKTKRAILVYIFFVSIVAVDLWFLAESVSCLRFFGQTYFSELVHATTNSWKNLR